MAKRAAPATVATPKKPFRQIPIATIEAGIRKANGYITIAAQLIGCDPSTVHRRVNASPALQQLVSDLTDRRLDTAELALDAAIGRGKGGRSASSSRRWAKSAAMWSVRKLPALKAAISSSL